MKKIPKIVELSTDIPEYKKDIKKLEDIVNIFMHIHADNIIDEVFKRSTKYGKGKV